MNTRSPGLEPEAAASGQEAFETRSVSRAREHQPGMRTVTDDVKQVTSVRLQMCQVGISALSVGTRAHLQRKSVVRERESCRGSEIAEARRSSESSCFSRSVETASRSSSEAGCRPVVLLGALAASSEESADQLPYRWPLRPEAQAVVCPERCPQRGAHGKEYRTHRSCTGDSAAT